MGLAIALLTLGQRAYGWSRRPVLIVTGWHVVFIVSPLLVTAFALFRRWGARGLRDPLHHPSYRDQRETEPGTQVFDVVIVEDPTKPGCDPPPASPK